MWKVEVIADSSGRWSGNSQRFRLKQDAEQYARDLMNRWMAVRKWRVTEDKEIKEPK